ncbi:MAG: anion transporter [Burkholderiaceae bacterium]
MTIPKSTFPSSALLSLCIPLKTLLRDYLFWILLLVLAGLTFAKPSKIPTYFELVDWTTIATLAGLLTLTKGVESSGLLHRLGAYLVRRMKTERALALSMVAATCLLATVLTNDVALFVMVPLTLSLRGPAADIARLPITRLIIFEALAANAGSALTAIGNPQNLYLWQQSRTSFAAFTGAMAPLAFLLMTPLILLTAALFSGRATIPSKSNIQTIDRQMLLLCLMLYPLFLLMTDLHHAPLALAATLVIFLLRYRSVLAKVDWGLLLLFILMFIDLRLVGPTHPVHALLASADLGRAPHLYLAAIFASQVISNVPATILLAQYTHDWRVLAYGVNAGGAGLAIGSLANIIALRMAPEKRAWLAFHVYSVPFLLVTGAAGYAWLMPH